jgi:hypothetical protein
MRQRVRSGDRRNGNLLGSASGSFQRSGGSQRGRLWIGLILVTSPRDHATGNSRGRRTIAAPMPISSAIRNFARIRNEKSAIVRQPPPSIVPLGAVPPPVLFTPTSPAAASCTGLCTPPHCPCCAAASPDSPSCTCSSRPQNRPPSSRSRRSGCDSRWR